MNEPGLYLRSENPEPIDWAARPTPDSAPSSGPLPTRIDLDCFLCRRPLTVGNPKALDFAIKEDLFPRWLWHRLQLAGGGAGINLLDGKWKNYPGVLVPCCRECNNNYMSEVEQRIAKGIKSFVAFEKLSRSVISEYTGVRLKQPGATSKMIRSTLWLARTADFEIFRSSRTLLTQCETEKHSL
jgi:hypothetical protein